MRFFLFSALVLVACGGPQSSSHTEHGSAHGTQNNGSPAGKVATTTLEPRSGTTIAGTARFEESGGQVTITLTLRGATPGNHGVHLHQNPDCSAADAASAGPHFNPDNAQHGGPDSAAHHAGDLGNITIAADGTGTLTLTSHGLTVSEGPTSVVGRSIVVHAAVDDLTSQPAGNSGARGACGVIALSQ